MDDDSRLLPPPRRASGKIGMYREAIEEALSMGYTRKEIAALLGLRYQTFWRAWKNQRVIMVPPEKQKQLPLPEEVEVQPAKSKQGERENNGTNAVQKRPLPGSKIPVGDGDAMLDELAKRGVHFK